MFTSQARNTTLGPSVPSEERYKSSVVIPAIHFLQDQGWTSGGSARSSGLSQGRFSRTSLERCRERQEWGLNAVAVEIPEVKFKSKETNLTNSDPLGL